jgi:hypothetical protein
MPGRQQMPGLRPLACPPTVREISGNPACFLASGVEELPVAFELGISANDAAWTVLVNTAIEASRSPEPFFHGDQAQLHSQHCLFSPDFPNLSRREILPVAQTLSKDLSQSGRYLVLRVGSPGGRPRRLRPRRIEPVGLAATPLAAMRPSPAKRRLARAGPAGLDEHDFCPLDGLLPWCSGRTFHGSGGA